VVSLSCVMHISKKLDDASKAKRVTFSFEFFPPKTAQVRASSSYWREIDLTSCRAFRTCMLVSYDICLYISILFLTVSQAWSGCIQWVLASLVRSLIFFKPFGCS
jgi:hypothetical protein